MNSIRRTLLIWLSVGLVLGIASAAGLIYLQAREQANALFDYQMRQLAASLPVQAIVAVMPRLPAAPPSNGNPTIGPPTGAASTDDPNALDLGGRAAGDQAVKEDIVVEIWDRNGLQVYRSHQRAILPRRAEIGFSDVVANGSGWRVYSVQIGATVVQIAQPQSARSALAAGMAAKTVAPLLLLLPFLAWLIWFTVGRGLATMQRVATEVQLRDAGSLAPISDHGLPQEIQPLATALNQLLRRLDIAIGAQRSFIADAAHELKTPLTALNLQIQLAERAVDAPERAAAFAEVKQGLHRASHLVHQLLTLARQEPGAVEPATETLDLYALARLAVADFAAIAADKQIDLGLQAAPAQGAVLTKGNPDALRTLISNLIDNAIRYCPPGARVDVAIGIDADHPLITVSDTGPGIAPDDLERVMDRFYRVAGTGVTGSGLGLAIVKQIAAGHGAQFSLRNGAPGLVASVRLKMLGSEQ
jgi:two-component system OmpR family sensor kinase